MIWEIACAQSDKSPERIGVFKWGFIKSCNHAMRAWLSVVALSWYRAIRKCARSIRVLGQDSTSMASAPGNGGLVENGRKICSASANVWKSWWKKDIAKLDHFGSEGSSRLALRIKGWAACQMYAGSFAWRCWKLTQRILSGSYMGAARCKRSVLKTRDISSRLKISRCSGSDQPSRAR